jgi:hypothetical protein
MAGPTEAYRVSAVAPRPAKASPADPPYDPAEIVAHVGSEVIQASEVLPNINEAVSKVVTEHAAELSPDPEIREMQLNQFRRTVMKQALDAMVQVKLLLSELRRKVPPEGLKKNEDHLRKAFNSAMIPRLMEQYKATSVIDLENKLAKVGSSLEMQRTVFSERELAGSWLRQQIKDDPSPPTHEQMLTYFRQHSVEWDTPARVRWLQLTAKFTNFGSKEEAQRELARWGNRIYRGEPFEQVAKAHSQDFASEDGGLHDWASKGSHRSQAIDDALFTLPKGALSQILEDEDGLHIIRVLDREEARQAPFTEVQAEIKKKLQDKGKDHRQAEYLAKLRETIPVWTIFDEDFAARTSAPTPHGPAATATAPAETPPAR